MAVSYKPIIWNKNKKAYDKLIILIMISYIIIFAAFTLIFNSHTSPETLIIRAFGSLAAVMLHIVLIIGPLVRLNTKFLPLLYNRRHLGVSMFLAALVHGLFSIIQFHTLGNTNALYSIFISNMDYTSLTNFPFQVLGFFALIILFFMAATSHDFWLKALSPKTWKRLHMMVYLAYILIILHVFLGAFQQETSPFTISFLSVGFLGIVSLHIITGFKEFRTDRKKMSTDSENWIRVAHLDEIEENRAKMVTANKERIAIFKYEGKLSAVHNVCKHQGGPLGEGKIVDGCITCPWHGYQYLPGNGQSPPPFDDRVATYRLKLVDQIVFVDPEALPEGTAVEPLKI